MLPPERLWATALLLSPTTAQAHEIGTTRVALSLGPSAAYHVEIATDAQALVRQAALRTVWVR